MSLAAPQPRASAGAPPSARGSAPRSWPRAGAGPCPPTPPPWCRSGRRRRLGWKVRAARDRTKRTIQIGVRSKFLQNSGIFARKFNKLKKFQHFLKYWRNSDKISSKSEQKSMNIIKICKIILPKNENKFDEKTLKYWSLSGAKACKSCRSRQELSNEYLVAKIGVSKAEDEPLKIRSIFDKTNYGI